MSSSDDLKKRLEAELEDVLSKHGRLSSHLRNEDRSVPKDWSDLAQMVENDEVLEHLEVHARQRIERLQRALVRLEEGTYSTCASCGNDIRPERLELLPTANVCSSCAE